MHIQHKYWDFEHEAWHTNIKKTFRMYIQASEYFYDFFVVYNNGLKLKHSSMMKFEIGLVWFGFIVH